MTLDPEAITAWADQNGKPGRACADIVTSREAHELIQHYVDQLNAGLNGWETIKRFTILERDLDLANDELTPSMKLKRKVVLSNFEKDVEGLYAN
ncbi:MAG: hypothetical protein V9F04_08275 [Dermatophilaceae bacterium]